jgi:cytochrome P450
VSAVSTELRRSLEEQLAPERLCRDPHPTYARLREEAPVYRSESRDGWLVSRYADVKRVLDAPASFSSADRVRPRFEHMPMWPTLNRIYGGFQGFFWSDPPEYTRHRKQVGDAFRPRLRGIDEQVARIVDELLDAVLPRGELDVISELAYVLPSTVVFEMLGIPHEHRAAFRSWSQGMLNLANPGEEAARTAMSSMDEAIAWLRGLLEERRERPQADMISELARDLPPLDEMSDEQVRMTVVTLIQFLLAGHETTTNLIGSGLYALLQHPDQLELLRREPELIDTAVEELLRWEPPLSVLSRRAVGDLELHGHAIRRDELVIVVLPAANRDPRQFPEPERLDVRRRPNRHLSFGHNLHFCLGAPLARVEGRIAIATVLERLQGLALAEEPQWNPNAQFRGLEALHVTFEP